MMTTAPNPLGIDCPEAASVDVDSRGVDVVCVNDTTITAYPVTVLRPAAQRTCVVVVGRVQSLRPWRCLTRSYALSRHIIEVCLGQCPGQSMQVQVYLSRELARRVAHIEPAFIHFPTGSLHVYPRSSRGHEVTHFVTYHAFGGRPRWAFLEEGLAEYFAEPTVRPHHTALAWLREPDGEGRLAREVGKWPSGQGAPNIRRSFVGHLLEDVERSNFIALWRHTGSFADALRATCRRSLTEQVERWIDYLRGRDVQLTRNLNPLLRDPEDVRAFQSCATCPHVLPPLRELCRSRSRSCAS